MKVKYILIIVLNFCILLRSYSYYDDFFRFRNKSDGLVSKSLDGLTESSMGLQVSARELIEQDFHSTDVSQLVYLRVSGETGFPIKKDRLKRVFASFSKLLYVESYQIQLCPETLKVLFDNNKDLRYLNIVESELSGFPVMKFSNLEYLSLVGKGYSSVLGGASKLNQIKHLHLFNWEIPELNFDFQKFDKLQSLSIVSSSVSSFGAQFDLPYSLSFLSLSDNNISDLPVVIEELPDLGFLDVSNNCLGEGLDITSRFNGRDIEIWFDDQRSCVDQ